MKYWDSKSGTFKTSTNKPSTSYGKGYPKGNSYYGGYGGNYGKSKGAGSYKSLYDDWGWSFDDSSTSFGSERYIAVKEPENYNTPKRVEIESKFSSMFSKSYRGTYIETERIQEMTRYFYYRMIEEKDYMKELKDINYGKTWLEQKIETYNGLWDQDVPGFTPLEKDLNIHAKLQEESKTGKQRTREEMENVDEDCEEIEVVVI